MPNPAIRISSLSKSYQIQHDDTPRATNLGEAIAKKMHAPFKRTQKETFWALKDIDLEIQRGEVVGVIGRNGAGKSTLLKVLSRITEPTSGRIELFGRVGSLLEVGTGFHPELTGRENIFLNGAILGMKRGEIKKQFDEIVDFAGVKKFLDTPVKRYSSGMYVRLAFAVAAHLNPEILIVDEVLAVGDVEFQEKCLGKMQDVAQSGRTVLFVSHNMGAVRSLTKTALVLYRGELNYAGETNAAINRYLDIDIQRRKQSEISSLDYYRRSPIKDSLAFIDSIKLNLDGEHFDNLPKTQSGAPIAIDLLINARDSLPDCCVSIMLHRNSDTLAITLYSKDVGFAAPLPSGTSRLRCEIHGLPLTPGRYTLSCGINKNDKSKAYDVIQEYPAFDVELAEAETGQIQWPDRPWGAVHWHDVKWEQVPNK